MKLSDLLSLDDIKAATNFAKSAQSMEEAQSIGKEDAADVEFVVEFCHYLGGIAKRLDSDNAASGAMMMIAALNRALKLKFGETPLTTTGKEHCDGSY